MGCECKVTKKYPFSMKNPCQLLTIGVSDVNFAIWKNPIGCYPEKNMKGHKEINISYWAAHATTIVSVTLVLILTGVIALLSTAAGSETRRLRENLELSAILADSISDESAGKVMADIRHIEGVKEAVLVGKAQAAEEWKAETGEDIEALVGVNPFSPEISFTLHADYATPASISAISKKIESMAGVEELASPDASLVEEMNSHIGALSIILGCIAVVMLVISFVLINNTVHLTIYSRRFTIHTMQLVGATRGFIRRPIVVHNLTAGLLAGLLAAGVLAAGVAFAPVGDIIRAEASHVWTVYAMVAVAITMAGALICALAAMLATSRYLDRDYSHLFS